MCRPDYIKGAGFIWAMIIYHAVIIALSEELMSS